MDNISTYIWLGFMRNVGKIIFNTWSVLGYVSVLLTKTYMNIEYDVYTQFLINIHIPQNYMISSLEQK